MPVLIRCCHHRAESHRIPGTAPGRSDFALAEVRPA